MTYGYPEEKESKQSKCILYIILFVVLSNLVISLSLVYGLYLVSAEEQAKRISNEIIVERMEAFRNYLDDPENRAAFTKEVSSFVNDIASHSAHDITKAFVSEAAASMVPYDVFSIADYLLNYDFTATTQLLGATMHSISTSFLAVERYEEVGQVLSAIASVVDIVSTVEPLSDSTAPPSSEEYSLLGQTILRLPATIQASLTEDVWKQTAMDCATIMNRLYFTDFIGTYNSPYGVESFNYNSAVKPVFSNIYDICLAIGSAPPVNA